MTSNSIDRYWRRGEDYGRFIPLRNRNIGLLGYEAVNQKVRRFLSGFDVTFHILRSDWEGKEGYLPTKATKYIPNQLHDFLTNIDIVIIGVSETSKTENLIG